MDYSEFERDWLSRHRGSRVYMPRVSSWRLVAGIVLWVVIALGAALVSGAHSVPAVLFTIPAVVVSPYREYLSLFGFAIFELLIFAGAAYRKNNRYAGTALILAMVGALAANVGSSIYAVLANGGDTLNLTVAVVLAIIAPVAAFLAGEMVNRLYTQHEQRVGEARAVAIEKQKELDRVINREYTKHYGKRVNSVNLTGLTPNKQRANPALDKAVNLLNEHPEWSDMTDRELVKYIGVSHVTINKARKQIKNEPPT